MNTIDLINIKLLDLNLPNDIIKLILKFIYCEHPECKDIIYRYYECCVPNIWKGFGELSPYCGFYCKKHYEQMNVFLTNKYLRNNNYKN